MAILTNEGDILKGDKIVCESRRVEGPKKINKSGRHKAQRVILKDNAECILIKKARFISRNPQ